MSAQQAQSVVVIGSGIIGSGVVANAARAGLDVAVWNRTPAHAEPLRAAGVEVFLDAAEAVRGRDLVVTALSDAQTTLSVVEPLLEHFAERAVWVQSATIGLAGIERVVELAEQRGVRLLDAPVSGTKTPAERGELVFLAAGDEADIDFAQPLFDAAGAKTLRLGELGNGSRLKLVANDWVLAQTAALAEAVKLCEGLGLDGRLLIDAIDGAPVGNPYAVAKGELFLSGEYPPNFPLEHGTKDARLISEAARAAGLELPLTFATERIFGAALAAGRGREDVAAIFEHTGEDDG